MSCKNIKFPSSSHRVYATLQLGSSTLKTSTLEGENVVFDESFAFAVNDPDTQSLRVTILTTSLTGLRTDTIGTLSFRVSDIVRSGNAMQGVYTPTAAGKCCAEFKFLYRKLDSSPSAALSISNLFADAPRQANNTSRVRGVDVNTRTLDDVLTQEIVAWGRSIVTGLMGSTPSSKQ